MLRELLAPGYFEHASAHGVRGLHWLARSLDTIPRRDTVKYRKTRAFQANKWCNMRPAEPPEPDIAFACQECGKQITFPFIRASGRQYRSSAGESSMESRSASCDGSGRSGWRGASKYPLRNVNPKRGESHVALSKVRRTDRRDVERLLEVRNLARTERPPSASMPNRPTRATRARSRGGRAKKVRLRGCRWP